MKKNWTKRDPIKNYFPVPNEIYSLGLSSDAISIYGYLLSREDRKTYQCLVIYRMISEAIGKCVTTVRKYVAELEERQLIRTEHTSVVAKDGRNLNGRLRYTILPIQLVIDEFNNHQLQVAEQQKKQWELDMNAARKAIQDRMRGITPPDKLTKKQRQIWEYLRLHPEETNYSVIAKGAKVTRHTVAKHFEMIRKMLGIQETAPHPLLDCQPVPLML